jgi:uncharacterized protein (DUF1697 family)
MRHLALLRGINVGGSRKLPMSDLEGAFRAAGASAVTTYIQSGNVLFETSRPADVCADAEKAIERRFGFRPTIVPRTARAWRAMVDANPFVKGGAAVESLHVACLARTPDRPIPGILDPEAVLPDEFVLAGADVYLRFPNGVGKSLISNARLDRRSEPCQPSGTGARPFVCSNCWKPPPDVQFGKPNVGAVSPSPSSFEASCFRRRRPSTRLRSAIGCLSARGRQ